MNAEYRTLVGKVAKAVLSIFQPPAYILDYDYRGKIADGMDDEIGVIPEERAKAILGTKKPVLGFYSGNGEIYLTTNPLNSDGVTREYVKWHEKGHRIYSQRRELKDAYPDEEAFCDFYAIGNFVGKYGLSELKRVADIGLISEKAIKLYKTYVKNVENARWN
jgi:hypothetical protein